MNFNKELTEVIESLVKRADAERRKQKPWENLWEASEYGLDSLLSETEYQMTQHVSAVCDIIKQKFGIKSVSLKLYNLLKALPFASWEIREHIKKEEGHTCCADKAREVYYQEVLEEINRIKG